MWAHAYRGDLSQALGGDCPPAGAQFRLTEGMGSAQPIAALSLTHAEFLLDGRAVDQRLVVDASGSAEMKSVDVLSAYMKTLHQEALQRHVEGVVFDMRNLQFLNSGCFKVLVGWIANAARATPSYRITFVGNCEVAWQKRSLGALRCVDERIVTLEGVDADLGPP